MDRASPSSQISIRFVTVAKRAILLSIFVCALAISTKAECAFDSESWNACIRFSTHNNSAANNLYTFPDAERQFRNYLDAAFGPFAVVRSSIAAGIDQSKPAPPEWDSGALGYGERYGSRFGMFLVTESARYSLGAAMHEDVAYHRCMCTGFVPRSRHALVSTFIARTRSGAIVPSLPALIAPYAGAFTAVNAWYPARYEPMDAARLGSMVFTFQIGGNMMREFLPHRP